MSTRKGTNILRSCQFEGWQYNPRHNFYVKSVDVQTVRGKLTLTTKVYFGKSRWDHPWEKQWHIDVFENGQYRGCYCYSPHICNLIGKSLSKMIQIANDFSKEIEEVYKNPYRFTLRHIECSNIESTFSNIEHIEECTPGIEVPMQSKVAEAMERFLVYISPENGEEEQSLKEFTKDVSEAKNTDDKKVYINWPKFRLINSLKCMCGSIKKKQDREYLTQWTSLVELTWNRNYAYRVDDEVKKLLTKAEFEKYLEKKEQDKKTLKKDLIDDLNDDMLLHSLFSIKKLKEFKI